MRSTLRSLTIGLLATTASASLAQYPYNVFLNGTIIGCYPGQMVNVQTTLGTDPAYNYDVPVDPLTCTWSTSFGVNSNPASWEVSTQCNGMIVSAPGAAQFNFFMDSVFVSVTLDCGGGQVYDCNGVLNGPDMPGTDCYVLNQPGTWSADCVCVLDSNVFQYDCNGILNGPNMPGTACDDGDPNTTNDTWSANCVCVGNPFGNDYDCLGILNGPNQPGTSCVVLNQLGTWSADCVCVLDSIGQDYDCLGILNGPNLPGTYCVNFFGDTGVWSVQCVCVTNSNNYDCLGILNGPNQPGTDCTIPGTTIEGTWSVDCVCVPDSNGFLYDCNGVLNGPDMPGTACDDGNPATINDTWSANCVCTGYEPQPCEASFWVLQAYGQDSLPIPYELWVWNLSSGGNGQFTYFWDFGDGTSSTEAFPTHVYDDNGPYNLCLTIADNNGCTDTYCDSVSINQDGIYEGMVVHNEDRSDGFTINVQNPNANSVQEITTGSIATWPNPAVDELNVAVVSELNGAVEVTITDLDGRVVMSERTSLAGGRSQLRLSTSELGAGLYLLRISDGATTLSQRFVKSN